jgi:protein ImuA
MGAARIAVLRSSLARDAQDYSCAALGHEAADACLRGGLRLGALHEVFAEAGHESAATGFAAALAARAGKHLLWIRQDFSAAEHGEVSATGFLALGLNPARILLLRVADAQSALRAACDALSCAGLGAVVIEILGNPKILDLAASRRLTLAAARKGVTAILLRFSANPDASAAETRWLVRCARSPREKENWGDPVFDAQLARNRHGRTGHWVMGWSAQDGHFREQAHPGAVVRSSGDRPAAAQTRAVA